MTREGTCREVCMHLHEGREVERCREGGGDGQFDKSSVNCTGKDKIAAFCSMAYTSRLPFQK